MKTITDRIMEKVSVSDSGCWIFTGARNNKGYGTIYTTAEGGKVKTGLPHRLMYADRNGPIPHGKQICHSCDTPLCCNPDHLFIGTQKDNIQDMIHKGRTPTREEMSELVKKSWTPELRAYRSKQTGDRMRTIRAEKARAAGVPENWKYCPDCSQWYPRSNYQKNSARYDGIKSICRKCSTAQTKRLRDKRQ